MISGKSITFVHNFSRGEPNIIDDMFHRHPIKYKFAVYQKKKGDLIGGHAYDVGLFIVNTSQTELLTGVIQADIEISDGRGEFHYINYELAPKKESLIALINEVKYNEQSINVTIDFWKGPNKFKVPKMLN